MNCSRLQKTLPDLLAGTVPPHVREEIESHINNCSVCREHHAEMRDIWDRLGELPAPEPDPSMDLRFEAMLDIWTHEGTNQPSTREATPWRKPWRDGLLGWASASFAFAMLSLIIGILIGSKLQNTGALSNPDTPTNLQDLSAKVEKLEQEMAFALLRNDSPSERLRGVLLASRLEIPQDQRVELFLNSLNTDPNVNVRLAALESLQPLLPQTKAQTGIPETLLRQTSPLLQAELIRLILDLDDPNTTEALRELLERNHLEDYVREAAQTGLSQLEMI